jgi:hypothetical protein
MPSDCPAGCRCVRNESPAKPEAPARKIPADSGVESAGFAAHGEMIARCKQYQQVPEVTAATVTQFTKVLNARERIGGLVPYRRSLDGDRRSQEWARHFGVHEETPGLVRDFDLAQGICNAASPVDLAGDVPDLVVAHRRSPLSSALRHPPRGAGDFLTRCEPQLYYFRR